MSEPITQDALKELLHYDHETGAFEWKARGVHMFNDCHYGTAKSYCDRWNKAHAGKPAFTARNGNGYFHGSILGRNMQAHRAAYLIHYGVEPENIDHIDGDRTNNKIENLRSVSDAENCRNKSLRANNRFGVAGVDRMKDGRFRARLSTRHIGSFKSIEEAVAARKAAEADEAYHANHGRPPHWSNAKAERRARSRPLG